MLADGKEIGPMDIKLNEGVTFSIDFNNESLSTARSGGEPAKYISGSNSSFVDGVKGKALYASGKAVSMGFKMKDNLTFSMPGTISLWIKPVKWKRPDDMPLEKDGKSKARLYQEFFLTNYNPGGGYLGIQRMTSPVNGGKDTIMVFCSGLKGVGLWIGKEVNLAEGEWHNIVMTWDPKSFILYIDGEIAGRKTIDRKISNNELSDSFSVSCPAETMLDEVYIYDHVLSPESIGELFQVLQKRN